jgi:sigma-54-specific transcriptional regulator
MMFAAGGPKLYATIEQTVVQAAYVHCRKNQVRTASLLGISRNILRHRLKLYGLI